MDTKATSALVGILLTLLFCGCGGGGDSTTKPSKPILSIGAGQSKSISKIQAPNKGLLKINLDENPVYRIYSVDGQLLEGPKIVENFPFSIEIDGLKKNKAAVQGVLVLCLSTVNKQYHSFIPFSEEDLSTNGPILENGGIRKEDLDGVSTTIANFVEIDLSRTLGEPFQGCQNLQGPTKGRIAKLSDRLEYGSEYSLDRLVRILRTASTQEDSLIAEAIEMSASKSLKTSHILSILRSESISGVIDISSVDLEKIAKTNVLVSEASKLAALAKSASLKEPNFSQKFEKLSHTLISSNGLTFAANLTGAQAIASGFELLQSETSSTLTTLSSILNTNLQSILAQAEPLSAAVHTFGDSTLVHINAEEVLAYSDPNSVQALNRFISANLAGSQPGSQARKNAESSQHWALELATNQSESLASLLEASFGHEDAIIDLVNAANNLKIDLNEAVALLKADRRQSIVKQIQTHFKNLVLQDRVKIIAAHSGIVETRMILSYEALQSRKGNYSYHWDLGGAGQILERRSGSASILLTSTPGIYTIRISQYYNGVLSQTAAHEMKLSVKVQPDIYLPSDNLKLRKGSSMDFSFGVEDGTGRDFNALVQIGRLPDCSEFAAGLSATINSDKVHFGVDESAESGDYCANLSVTSSTTGETTTKKIEIAVLEDLQPRVFITPILDQREGDRVTLEVSAIHQDTTTGILSLTVSNGIDTWIASRPLSGGSTILSTTLVNIAAGHYTAVASLGILSDSLEFSVNMAGAPTGLMVKLNGQRVESGDVIGGELNEITDTFTLDLSAIGATSYEVSGAGIDITSATGEHLILSLPRGTHKITAAATNAKNLRTFLTFSVIISQNSFIELSHIILSSQVAGPINAQVIKGSTVLEQSESVSVLRTSFQNNVFSVDASNLASLTLSESIDTLDYFHFNIFTTESEVSTAESTPESSIATLDIEITLTSNESSLMGQLKFNQAVLQYMDGSNTGQVKKWSLIEAGDFSFYGKRGNGEEVQFELSSESVNLETLFTPISIGLKVHLLVLRNIIRNQLLELGELGLAQRLNTLSGDSFTIRVKFDGDLNGNPFYFRKNGNRFQTIEIQNIRLN